jgi:hypothetical protein
VGGGGLVRTSPDGLTWTTQTSNVTMYLNSVTWTGSLYAAVGEAGNPFVVVPLGNASVADGTNLVAVEVHQVHGLSDDMSFALELTAQTLEVEPWIVTQPGDMTVDVGSDTHLEVGAVGGPLFFQWHGEDGQAVPGARGSRMDFENAGTGGSAGFYVVITNRLGSVTSRVARVTVSLTDSDGDGMPDYWEVRHGLRPDDPGDAALDADGDGMSNLKEYQRGSNPLVSDLVLSIEPMIEQGDVTEFILRFSVPALTAGRLEFKARLFHPEWETLEMYPAESAARVLTIRMSWRPDRGFFRLVLD